MYYFYYLFISFFLILNKNDIIRPKGEIILSTILLGSINIKIQLQSFSYKIKSNLHKKFSLNSYQKLPNLGVIGEELFKEENCKDKKEYFKKVRTEGSFLGGIALEIIAKQCKLIIGIYLDDQRYEENPWIILKPEGEEYKGIILLYLKQGNIKSQNGHYSA